MINGQVGKIFGVNLVTFEDLECCRSCGHCAYLHIMQIKIKHTFPKGNILPSQRCDPQTDNGCSCEEFIPESNLIYLEYLYDKKQA